MKKKTVAFVCTHNSCRSIMAEGWAKHLGSHLMDVYSAGTEKFSGPKILALEVMEEAGVDMSHAQSKLLDQVPSSFDILITMGCGVECPYVPCKYREDWGLDDPSGHPKEEFEKTRDLIKEKVLHLIKKISTGEYEG